MKKFTVKTSTIENSNEYQRRILDGLLNSVKSAIERIKFEFLFVFEEQKDTYKISVLYSGNRRTKSPTMIHDIVEIHAKGSKFNKGLDIVNTSVSIHSPYVDRYEDGTYTLSVNRTILETPVQLVSDEQIQSIVDDIVSTLNEYMEIMSSFPYEPKFSDYSISSLVECLENIGD